VAGSQADYVRHRRDLELPGATPGRVSQLVKSGKLARAFRPDGLLDFAAADRLWSANQIPQVVVDPRSSAAVRGAESETGGRRVDELLEPQPHGGSLKRKHATGEDAEETSLVQARLRLDLARAETAELKLAKQRGELLEIAEARKTWHAIGRMYAQARENVPKQLAPQLVGKTDLLEIEQAVRTAYRDADTRVANEIESRFKEVVGNGPDDGSADQ
jgi:hypothetical protein